VPIRDRQAEVFAVVQFLNKLDGSAFTVHDEQKLERFSPALSLVLEGCRRLSEYQYYLQSVTANARRMAGHEDLPEDRSRLPE
jgi:hypothetical protein